MMGHEELVEAEFLCWTQSFCLSPAEKGKGRNWNGVVHFSLEPTVFKLIFDGSTHPWCI